MEAQGIAHAAVLDAGRALPRPVWIVGGAAVGGPHRLELDHRRVAQLAEAAARIPDIGDAARHAGGEVAAGLAEHHDDSAGHVFAAMVAGALDYRDGAGVAHREALAGDALEISFAGNRAIEHGIADDDVRRRVAHAGSGLAD